MRRAERPSVAPCRWAAGAFLDGLDWDVKKPLRPCEPQAAGVSGSAEASDEGGGVICWQGA